MSRLLPLTLLAVLALAVPAVAAPLREYAGAMHEHSSYSDGWPGSRPADYYASGRRHGLDFMVGSEHSDNADVPVTTSEECLGGDPTPCLAAGDPDHLRKWEATQEQADAATGPGFTAGRGFEWSSDRFGHINVYWSRNETGSLTDNAALDTFYSWLKRSPDLGGGADGLTTFNHPGDKSLCGQIDLCSPPDDPAYDWNDFAYDPALDATMVGLEVFNGRKPFGDFFVRALDKGWHLGAYGAEDKDHDRTDDWGADDLAKTVMLAPDRSRGSLRAAMAARRVYATVRRGVRLAFTVDGAPMGSRLPGAAARAVRVHATGTDADGTPLDLDLVTNGGAVVGAAAGRLDLRRGPGKPEYLFLRARRGTQVVGFSSPIWRE